MAEDLRFFCINPTRRGPEDTRNGWGLNVADQQQITTYLIYQIGDGPAQTVIWDTISITVGRLDSQDIVVRDPEVSREHAVFRQKDDRYTVEGPGHLARHPGERDGEHGP